MVAQVVGVPTYSVNGVRGPAVLPLQAEEVKARQRADALLWVGPPQEESAPAGSQLRSAVNQVSLSRIRSGPDRANGD